ncbi:MAG: hypothetical protein M3Y27_06325 [Acidobacteriota bacterium]|nr:hypothetical protein [Acidobacteriota bacterium]
MNTDPFVAFLTHDVGLFLSRPRALRKRINRSLIDIEVVALIDRGGKMDDRTDMRNYVSIRRWRESAPEQIPTVFNDGLRWHSAAMTVSLIHDISRMLAHRPAGVRLLQWSETLSGAYLQDRE